MSLTMTEIWVFGNKPKYREMALWWWLFFGE